MAVKWAVGTDVMRQLLDAMGVDYEGKPIRKVVMEIVADSAVTVTVEYLVETEQVNDVCAVIARSRE